MSDLSFFLSPVAIAATLITLMLVAVDMSIVLRDTVWATRTLPRWTSFLPIVACALMVAQIAANLAFNFAFVLMSVPLYLATLLFAGVALVQGSGSLLRWARKRPQLSIPRRFKLPQAARALLCAALVLLGALRLGQTYAFAASISSRIAVLERTPGGADLSDRSWSQAFAGLIEVLKVQYPFTTWKRIDWHALYTDYAQRIAAAEARQDSQAYYRALREFAWRIPDGHVGIEGDDLGLANAEIGGSFGLTLLRLDDGRLVVSALVADGPAATAGIRHGAEIVAWNGAPVEHALAMTTVIWSEYPPATYEGKQYQQVRFLSRGPVGDQVDVTFRNRDEQAAHHALLTAIPAALDAHGDEGPAGLIRPAVTSRLLPSGYGLIRVKDEAPNLAGFPDAEMRQAVAHFVALKVPGLIIDVRDNLGGESKLTANMLAFFQPEKRLYQYLGLLDPETGSFRPATGTSLTIEPAQTQVQVPVAVLIDNYSHSSAEDLAMLLQDLPNVIVVGMSGSAGAGGIGETDVQMPGDYTFMFPKAQSLDLNFAIQLESDYTGNGGVTPDIRLPLDEATVDALVAGRDIVLDRAEATLGEQMAATQ